MNSFAKACASLGRRLILYIAIIAFLGLPPIIGATTYYVAEDGIDSNPGTNVTTPFLTIQKAASIMQAGDICYIRKGIYRETVIPANSGTSNAPITFTSYAGEPVIVSGANVLNTTWTTYSNSIYVANTTNTFRQLLVDGAMMNEARWPNAQADNLLNVPRAKVGSSSGATSLTDTNLPNLNLVGATLHLFPGAAGGEYEADTRSITGFDSITKTISWSSNASTTINPGNPYYIYGKLELLDIPTEWYLDSGAQKLYLWAPDGASPQAHLVEYKARDEAFVLDNLSFIDVNSLYVFASGISMRNSTNCIANDCHLRYVQHFTTADWNNSSAITNSCTVGGVGNEWINSSILVSSQSGLWVRGSGILVSNCVIEQVDYYPGSYFASISLVTGNKDEVVGNTLSGSGRFLVMGNALQIDVASNDMSYGQMLTKDGGGFYTFGYDGSNTRIHNNWVHQSDVGIYLDNGDANYQVYRNVCYNNVAGIQINVPGTNHLVYNNTLIGNKSSIAAPFGSGTEDGTQIINTLADGAMSFASGCTTNKNGWFPPVGADFVPQPGSGAIDGGQVIPGYTDGYLGSGPDIGAYETGAPYWTPGASFTIPPFPTPNSTTVPPAPTQLTGSVSPTNIVLSWTASPTTVSYYNVKRSAVSGGPYTNIAEVIIGAYYTDTNVTSGTTYYYVVSAVNSTGESGNSAEASIATTVFPFIMDNSDAVGITIVGAWTSSASVSGYYGTNYIHDGNTGSVGGKSVKYTPNFQLSGSYQVYMNFTTGTNRATNTPVDINYSGGSTTLSVNEQTNGSWQLLGTYNFDAGTNDSVVIRNDGASGYVMADAFKFVEISGMSNSAPQAPTGLVAAGGNLVVNLNWTQSASAGINGNNVYRSTSGSGGPYNLLANLAATTSYSDTVVNAGSSYYYSVTALNGNGESSLSTYAGATTTPPAPTGLSTLAGNSQVALSWNTAAGANSYNVKRATVSGGPYTTLANVTSASFTDTTAANGTTYYYVVSAVNSSGESANSNEASATPTCSLPSTPAGLAATAGNNQVALTWSAVSGATSYNVKRAITSGGPYTTIGSPTGTSYTDTTAVNGTTYYYVVSALNTCGESANSSEASSTPSASAPTFVAAGAVSSGTSAITPALPSGIANGDILLLFIETANQAVSISNPNGGIWTEVTGSPQGTGTAGSSSATRLTAFWSRFNGTQGAPTIADSGDHQIARMIAIRGATTSGNPWDVTAGGIEATSDTSGSIPGATTTVANTLVVVAATGNAPDANGTSNFSGWSNASLTSLTERTDDTRSSGNGGALGVATGVNATAGAYGNTAVTFGTSAVKGMISIAIKN